MVNRSLASLGVFLLCAAVGITGQTRTKPLPPIDPQKVQDQDAMTWDDYRPIPGRNWADPSLKPERPFRLAVVAIDFPDQPFVITLPKGSDPFGNPQIDPVPREQVPQFYADFFTKPSAGQSRPDDHRVPDGAVEGQGRHHRGRRVRAVPHAEAAVGVRPQRVRPERLDPRRQQGVRADGAGLRRDLERRGREGRPQGIRRDSQAVRGLRRNRRLAGIRRDEVQLEGGHPGRSGAIRIRRSRAGYPPGMSPGPVGWRAPSSGGCPPCGRERTRGPSRTRSGTWCSAFPISTTTRM